MTSQEKLREDLRDFISAIDQDRILTDEIRENMVVSLYLFVNNSVSKFAIGQKEHGGDIRDKPLPYELSQELIDLFWYKEAFFHWPKLNDSKPKINYHP